MGTCAFRAEQHLLLAMKLAAARGNVELTAEDQARAQDIARRVAAVWQPGEPLYDLYPAERGLDGVIRWDPTGRSLADTGGRLFA